MTPPATRKGLGHEFRRPELLAQALTHRSFGATHNERLEFIGDAVLNCAIAAALYERYPQMDEGDLSRLRANLVNRDTLAGLAQEQSLGAAIRLGEGEVKSGGAPRPSILADAFEAVIGAIFLDAGFDAARDTIARVYSALIAQIDPGLPARIPRRACRNGCRRAASRCPTTAWCRSRARRTRRHSPWSAGSPRSASRLVAMAAAGARPNRRRRSRPATALAAAAPDIAGPLKR